MQHIRLELVLPSMLMGAMACSDAGLQPVQGDDVAPVDNKLRISGEICTEVPSDELFPVKVMLIVDTSGSLQFTDPAAQRASAVGQLLDRYAGNPAVEFSVVAFDAVVQDLTNGFTSNPNVGDILSRLSQADRLTDYQGALGSAYATLTNDMRLSSPAERARSKYVIIFFSDGSPDPQCVAGEPPKFLVCDIDRDEWPDTFTLPAGINPNTGVGWTWEDFQGLYPDLDAGKNYNTEPQLLQKVRDIMELQEIYGVNEIRFHTGFLYDPNVIQAAIDAFGLDRQAGIDLLTSMSEVGNGTFTEFSSGGDISFLNINYTSVKQGYAMTNLIVENRSAIPERDPPENVYPVDGLVPDSDRDGLPDYLENEMRLCAYDRGGVNCRIGNTQQFKEAWDSDGDGYTDFFEYVYMSSGFDPASADDFAASCTDVDDSDGDGLRDCEEVFIGTDTRLMDSDGDRVPDGVEFRFGLDPTERDDALFDNDSDGLRNREEILMHWDPNAKEPAENLPPQYEYVVEWLGEDAEGKNCYGYEVSNIRLVTTQGLTPEDRGRNRIWLSFLEGPPDDPRDFGTSRVACIDAKFISPDLKSPASGRLQLLESDFYAPGDPAIECVPGDRRLEDESTDPNGAAP